MIIKQFQYCIRCDHLTILELNSVCILVYADVKEISLAYQINLRHNDVKISNFLT